MRRQSRTPKPSAEINVVPYIDVMLVLLVIFMITTPLLSQGVDVDLPKAQSKVIDASDQEPIIVSVDANGRYYLNLAENPSKSLSPRQLATRINAEIAFAKQSHRQMAPVLVRGDHAVPYGKVVQAMVLIQRAGVPKVGLMTDSTHDANTGAHA